MCEIDVKSLVSIVNRSRVDTRLYRLSVAIDAKTGVMNEFSQCTDISRHEIPLLTEINGQLSFSNAINCRASIASCNPVASTSFMTCGYSLIC